MHEGNDSWIPAFQDKPLASGTLSDFHAQIMVKVLSDPVDFRARTELARRRRWGLAFVGSWLGLGLSCLWVLIFMPQAGWGFLLGKIRFAVGLGIAAESLWQEYSWHLTGLAVTAGFLVAGLKGRSSSLGPEDSRAAG
ncbi:Hypothetical protein DEACI_0855 [Acididesulfobacillus acetoxydans]|uniref:Uncharacterized protein n=2 Tax=Acididesulfobacillus acetoxydans TaxID=1561005 RepID=A0A8S0VVY0_9FIRM|nr:hypothetical protein [Acididesulfobacillus acetoxydans]CAA7600203.1 Hypothetical protein DEACI_0855 [Acididesulfobacillus acetoxydans]CEJ09581.1 Hypothetical protein DEACI_4066 [Acididesulfobacillus acetoxydans]